MRSVGSEILSLVVILLIPATIVLAFPFEAFVFRPSAAARHFSRTAFVRLSPEAERQALRAARASWQEKGDGVRRLQADIFRAELPEESLISVLSVRDRSRPPLPPMVLCERRPFLPSLRAAPPLRIKQGKVVETSVFSREELLKMN